MVFQTADKEPVASDVLKGKRIVVTRARSQALNLVQRLEELGGEIVEFPTIEIRPPKSYDPLDQAIRQIANYDWLIFTSVNGVEQFLSRFEKLEKNLADLAEVAVGAIGPETASRLSAARIQPNLVPKQYQAEGILESLASETLRGKRVLIPRATRARDILPDTLRQWGAQVDVVEAYQTVLPEGDVSALCALLRAGRIDLITFTSPSTATNFAAMLRNQNLPRLLSGVAVACIGPITKQTVENLGLRSDIVSEEFTIPGLVNAMVDYFFRTLSERLQPDMGKVKT